MNRRLKIRAGAVEWRKFEDEVVAVDTRKSVYLAVNKSGSILWPALLDGASRSELVERLVDAFELDQTSAERDVDDFVQVLDEQDLLEP